MKNADQKLKQEPDHEPKKAKRQPAEHVKQSIFKQALINLLPEQPVQFTLWCLAALFFFGLVLSIGTTIGQSSIWLFLRRASLVMLLAAASVFVGNLVGFLFGLPRTKFKSATEIDLSNSSNAGAQQRTEIVANTNLEEISDWLTKILVGVGLTQIHSIRLHVLSLIEFIRPGLTRDLASAESVAQAQVLCASIFVYFPVLGFIFGWLWTRIYLPGAMRDAEGVVAMVVKKLTSDERSMNLIRDFLNPGTEEDDASPELEQRIVDEIKKVSDTTKARIFHLARATRKTSEMTKDDDTRFEKIERTIPVFRGLINSDERSLFHRNHGQLGYSLIAKKEPAWDEAIDAIKRAIKIRNSVESSPDSWLLYEFSLVMCNFERTRELKIDEIPKHIQQDIEKDLKMAMRNKKIREILSRSVEYPEWFKDSPLYAQVKGEQAPANP